MLPLGTPTANCYLQGSLDTLLPGVLGPRRSPWLLGPKPPGRRLPGPLGRMGGMPSAQLWVSPTSGVLRPSLQLHPQSSVLPGVPFPSLSLQTGQKPAPRLPHCQSHVKPPHPTHTHPHPHTTSRLASQGSHFLLLGLSCVSPSVYCHQTLSFLNPSQLGVTSEISLIN